MVETVLVVLSLCLSPSLSFMEEKNDIFFEKHYSKGKTCMWEESIIMTKRFENVFMKKVGQVQSRADIPFQWQTGEESA